MSGNKIKHIKKIGLSLSFLVSLTELYLNLNDNKIRSIKELG